LQPIYLYYAITFQLDQFWRCLCQLQEAYSFLRQSVLETQYTDRLVLSRYLLPLIGTKCTEHHAFVFLHDSKAYTCASRHGDSSAAAAENVTVQFTPMQTGIRLNIVPDASVTKQGAATPCGWEGNRRFWHRTGATHWSQTSVVYAPTGWAQGLRDMIWHTNWTEPRWSATSRPSYTTRSLVTCVNVTTWLAAAKLGRLVLSQFVCCKYFQRKSRVQNSSSRQYQTHMLSPTLAAQQLARCSSLKDSAEQDRQILQIGQHTHLLPSCRRNSWYMA